MSRWCDRSVTAGILFLIFFTPFAFGSVHPWAFSLMEAVLFLLVAVWMAKEITVKGEELGVRGQRAESKEQGTDRLTPSASHLPPHVSRLTPYPSRFLSCIVWCS